MQRRKCWMYMRTSRGGTWRKCDMVETKIKIKVEEKFPAGINVVKGIESDNDDVPKKESSSIYNKDRYEYEEGTDEVTGNKEIEQENTEIAVYEDITFWPWTWLGQLLVDLEILAPKMFQNKNEPFALTVRPGKNSQKVMLQHWFYKTMENRETVLRSWLLYPKWTDLFLFQLLPLPEDRATQIKSSKKFRMSKVLKD